MRWKGPAVVGRCVIATVLAAIVVPASGCGMQQAIGEADAYLKTMEAGDAPVAASPAAC